MAQNDVFCPEMLSALQSANSILLCTHIFPDGDAIGSTLAMGRVLKTLGKQVTLACTDPVPGSYRFLPGAEAFVQPEALDGAAFDVGFAIDCADLKRTGACAEAFSRCPVTMQIDHHPTNPSYAQINVVDGTAPAAGCIVRRAIRALGVPLDAETAQCLYCAISTDTGNFCFRGTTPEAFRIAAELVETGFPLAETARRSDLDLIAKYISSYVSVSEGVDGVEGATIEYENHRAIFKCTILTNGGSQSVEVELNGVL